MKNNKLLIGFTLLISLASCKKYLDQDPDTRAEVNTVDKVAQLVTSAYPTRNYFAITETYSDNVQDKGPGVGHLNEPFPDLYFWKDIKSDGNNTPTEYWNGVYAGIAAANQALESIKKYNLGDAVNPYKGEALVARAYGHFMLVTLFAKAYRIGGDNSSPGIPYVTEPETEVIKKYTRGTVASVYDNIQKDLEEGMPLLAGGQWKVPKYHFTVPAANAFASRFYLFKGDWDKAIQAANKIFPNGDFTGNIRPQATEWRNATLNEYNIMATKADQKYNLLLSETYSVYQRSTAAAGSRYGFGTQKYQEVYNGNTVAGAPFYNKGISYGVPHYTVYILREYFHYTNVAAGIGYPYVMSPLFVSDEALINRAEAYVNKGNFADALKDLNLFASARIVNYNPATHAVTLEKAKAFFKVTDDKEALIKTVLQFKQIAFMGEGMRWFDMLRHRIPSVHTHIAADGTETTQTLEPDDNRRMFQIPQEATIAGIELNPR
ncbi:RagB/SusD family nutrient uptake outer membrane protein [Haoranjiania flava]|uniref:RagB/SusD family nutrient uptake outer membrane protein n=1 Tax=Haoranjiania flava TaxID=1856322 RepID=A0AAE3ILZ4_9BACT|nr:RagB/SusD family nutrient uptake outer membrane protein [Haoranjiania flava]MCU7694308.1 RagB/SusD family nutrient uptake outer membrane protein [Haoranjiania flava]